MPCGERGVRIIGIRCKRGHSYSYRDSHGHCAACTRARKVKLLYGIVDKEPDITECQICGRGDERLGVDHDHQTNKVRGYLCKRCNFGLGSFKDSLELLDR